MTDSLADFVSRFRRAMGSPLDFKALALELFQIQFERNLIYRQACEARRLRPGVLREWQDIPALPVAAFKDFSVSCLQPRDWTAEFHSSGTTRRKPSRHLHNGDSLALYEVAVLTGFQVQVSRGAGLPPDGFDLAILTPPPSDAPHSSLVHMFATLREHFGQSIDAFLGCSAEDGWTIDSVRARRKLANAARPMAVLGTAFSFVQLLDQFSADGIELQLPKGSFALETGGYKGRSRALPRPALHALITKRLGIAADRIAGEYGMSELSSQAYAWADGGVFQFPPWARALVISPETSEEVGDG